MDREGERVGHSLVQAVGEGEVGAAVRLCSGEVEVLAVAFAEAVPPSLGCLWPKGFCDECHKSAVVVLTEESVGSAVALMEAFVVESEHSLYGCGWRDSYD